VARAQGAGRKEGRDAIVVGTFVLLAATVVGAMLVWISGFITDLLDPPVRYYTLLEDAEGLDAGAIVHLAGIPAGRVRLSRYCPEGVPVRVFREHGLYAGGPDDQVLQLDEEAGLYRYRVDDGRYVLVVFTVGRSQAEALLQDAELEVQTSIFGGPTLNINPGTRGDVLPAGAYVPGYPSTMAKLIGEFDVLRDRVGSVGEKLERVLVNVERLTGEDSSLSTLLANGEQVSRNLVSITARVDQQLEQLGDPETIENVRQSAANLRSLLAQLEATASEHLDPALARIASLAERAERLLAENEEMFGAVLAETRGALVEVRAFTARLGGFLDRLEVAVGNEDEGLVALSGEMRLLVQNADGLVSTLRRRVAEFKWSYLHYILFAPDAGEEARARLFDLARELTLGQEEMLAAVGRLDRLLERPGLDSALREDLEHHRAALTREIEKAEEIQTLLLDRLQDDR
jgi:ABC-type transporter Mla subunit MlaD